MWIMSMLRLSEPTRYEVFIGDVTVAEIAFGRAAGRSVCYLRTLEDVQDFPTMSDALRELHRRLKSPSPDGATVGRRGTIAAEGGDEPRAGRGRRSAREGSLAAASRTPEAEEAERLVGVEGPPDDADVPTEAGEGG